jgi:hypothetical protein
MITVDLTVTLTSDASKSQNLTIPIPICIPGLFDVETPGPTTGKPEFAVCENLCRAFSFERTAKKRSAKKMFVVRFTLNARQRNSLPCVFYWRTTNIFFSHQTLHSLTTVSLCITFAVR